MNCNRVVWRIALSLIIHLQINGDAVLCLLASLCSAHIPPDFAFAIISAIRARSFAGTPTSLSDKNP